MISHSDVGPFTWQDVYDALNEEPAYPKVPLGEPGATKGKQWPTGSSKKYVDLLGKPHEEVFRPLRVTVRDAMDAALTRGWVWTGKYGT